MKALLHHESGFDRISLEQIYIFGFHQAVALNPEAIALNDPSHPQLLVGERFTHLGGKKTSAGYLSFTLIEQHDVMEYRGLVTLGNFRLLCFDFVRSGVTIPPEFRHDYQVAYYGWIELEQGAWFVNNTANAGRVLQTEQITLHSQQGKISSRVNSCPS